MIPDRRVLLGELAKARHARVGEDDVVADGGGGGFGSGFGGGGQKAGGGRDVGARGRVEASKHRAAVHDGAPRDPRKALRGCRFVRLGQTRVGGDVAGRRGRGFEGDRWVESRTYLDPERDAAKRAPAASARRARHPIVVVLIARRAVTRAAARQVGDVVYRSSETSKSEWDSACNR